MSRLNPRFLEFLVFLTASALTITGCAQAESPAALDPIPTLQTIRLGYEPALQPWADLAGICADDLPGTVIIPIEVASDDTRQVEISLKYYIGQMPASEQNIYPVGVEELIFITNSVNPITELEPEVINAILSGRVTDWQTAARLSASKPYSETITLVSYPIGDPLQKSLSAGTTTLLPPQTQIVPDPEAMLQAVQADPGALGYLPLSWLVKRSDLAVNNIGTVSTELQVVIISAGQVDGAVKALLNCLQTR